MTRALIVGASSPLGTAIAARFAAEGHDVVGISRSGQHGAHPVDVADRTAIAELLTREQPKVAVYLARPELPEAQAGSAETIERSVCTLRDFATLAEAHGLEQLVFASSAAVYGTDAQRPLTEDSPTPAPGAYAQLKLRSEHALAEVSSQTDLRCTSFRIFNVYGPGFATSLVNRLICAANGGEAPTVFNTQRFVRDYVRVDDVATVFAAATLAKPASGAINIGTGVGTSNRELLALIPDAPWIPGTPLEIASMSVAEISRLRELLNFVPPARLAESLEHL